MTTRIDQASRIIHAPPSAIYQAFAHEKAIVTWLPPQGMTGQIWTFLPVPEGTKVSIRCQNVPPGIQQVDHEAGMTSTLENLAAFLEAFTEYRRHR